jgi:hypothetical protein
LRRGSVDTYPPFPENIFCLALIPGESGDSSLGLGFDRKGKIAVISANPERFSGEIFGVASDSRSVLIMGDLRSIHA